MGARISFVVHLNDTVEEDAENEEELIQKALSKMGQGDFDVEIQNV